MRDENKGRTLIWVLAIVIVLLVLFILFIFVVRPSFTKYVIKQQNLAQQYVISSIVYQLQQQGYVQLPVGNQTLVLVPYQAPSGETGTGTGGGK